MTSSLRHHGERRLVSECSPKHFSGQEGIHVQYAALWPGRGFSRLSSPPYIAGKWIWRQREVMCPLLDRLPCPVLDSVGCCCHYCSASDIQPTRLLSSASSLPPPPPAVLPWWLSCSSVLSVAVAFAVSLCLLCLKYFYLCFCPYLTWVASF